MDLESKFRSTTSTSNLIRKSVFYSLLGILGVNCGSSSDRNSKNQESQKDAQYDTVQDIKINFGNIDTATDYFFSSDTGADTLSKFDASDSGDYEMVTPPIDVILSEADTEKKDTIDIATEDLVVETNYDGDIDALFSPEEDAFICTKEIYYKDKDNDGFPGYSEQLEDLMIVCAGQFVPKGYLLKNEKGWDCDDENCAVFPENPDICDYLDIVCDSIPDNNFDAGDSCSLGEGICKGVGTLKCTPDGTTTYCDAFLGSPEVEVCDDLDNDCNGKTDEDDVCIPVCIPNECVGQGDYNGSIKECGIINDGCDKEINCGSCGNDALECLDNICVPIKCTDSDGGEEYNVKGTTSGANDALLGWLASATDTCEGNILKEYVCFESKSPDSIFPVTVSFTEINCQYGCANGACKLPPNCTVEVCDAQDNDCNGKIDENLVLQQECGVTDEGECSLGVEFNFCLAGKYIGWQICDAVFPTLEECDGKDNDCDGLTDDGLEKGTFYADVDGDGYGSVEDFVVDCQIPKGYITVGGDCDDFSYDINPNQLELCDGLDNNCDDSIDELFNVWETCSAGIGECFNEGVYQCAADKNSTYCNAVAKEPSEEVCDGLDNNCNGETDEYLTLEQECGVTEEGECNLSLELKYCLDGNYINWIGCDAILPIEELCNGLDDNCNGTPDDGFNVGMSCFEGVGECAVSGSVICAEDGSFSYCDALPKKQAEELCDGLDNDCNGEADNGLWFTMQFFDGDMDGYGTLDKWVIDCKPLFGYVSSNDDCNDNNSEVHPGFLEKCDGLDNDCDGDIDENLTLTQVCGLSSIGTCTFEMEFNYCIEGSYTGWKDCNAIFPQSELCDYLDNDCDTFVDNGFDVGDSCSNGTGECKVEGTKDCLADFSGTYCTAIPKEPKAELCDKLDNDCDGQIDEGYICKSACYLGGPIGNWKLDENGGTTAYDTSGKENHGTIYGATWTTGVSGSALSFDGNDYVYLGDGMSVKPAKNISLVAWFKTNGSGNTQTIGRYRSFGWYLWMSKDGLSVNGYYPYGPGENNNITSVGSYADGDWHFTALTLKYENNGTTVSSYIDGKPTGSAFSPGKEIYYGDGYAAIGRDGDKDLAHFYGEIDEFKIYSCTLTLEDIASEYQAVCSSTIDVCKDK